MFFLRELDRNLSLYSLAAVQSLGLLAHTSFEYWPWPFLNERHSLCGLSKAALVSSPNLQTCSLIGASVHVHAPNPNDIQVQSKYTVYMKKVKG